MRHTFKCQLPATANGFLLPARSALFPLPFSRSFSLLLSITRSFFFVLFSICHTHRAPPLRLPLASLLPAIAAPFFFSKLASITGGKRRKRVGAEKGMWADCVCVRGHPPRLSRDLHRNVHTFFLVAPSPHAFLCLCLWLSLSVPLLFSCFICYQLRCLPNSLRYN